MNNIEKLQKELVKKGYNIKKAIDIKQEEKLLTEIFPLDYVLDKGISQIEGGHRIEFWGKESTGKSTFALKIVKKYQELDKICVLVDAEKSFDTTWASMLGVDINKLLIIYPNTLEEFGDMVSLLIPTVDLIIVDSIVSLIPEEEINRDTNQPTMALGARINAIITRKIYNALTNRNTTIIFINQIREKPGVMYGNPYTSGGGHALLHFYNTRIEFKLGKPIEEGEGENKIKIGYEIHLRCIKNKKGRPYRNSIIDLYFDGNIDNKKSLFHQAIKYGIITKNGVWFEYNNLKEQGKEALIKKITDKDWRKIEKEIWEKIK